MRRFWLSVLAYGAVALAAAVFVFAALSLS